MGAIEALETVVVLAKPEVDDKLRVAFLLSTFFFRPPCSPPLVALAAAFLAFFYRRTALQLEILALRHQLGVLNRLLSSIIRKRSFLMIDDILHQSQLARGGPGGDGGLAGLLDGGGANGFGGAAE